MSSPDAALLEAVKIFNDTLHSGRRQKLEKTQMERDLLEKNRQYELNKQRVGHEGDQLQMKKNADYRQVMQQLIELGGQANIPEGTPEESKTALMNTELAKAMEAKQQRELQGTVGAIRQGLNRDPEFARWLAEKKGVNLEDVGESLQQGDYASIMGTKYQMDNLQREFATTQPSPWNVTSEVGRINHASGVQALNAYDRYLNLVERMGRHGYWGEKEAEGVKKYISDRLATMATDPATPEELRKQLLIRQGRKPSEFVSSTKSGGLVLDSRGNVVKVLPIPFPPQQPRVDNEPFRPVDTNKKK